MLYAVLRDCGGQVVAHLLLVRANICGTDVRRNHRVYRLRTGECFRQRIRTTRVGNEWFRALVCESFQALRVTAYDAHFLSLSQKFLGDYASRVSCGTSNDVHKLLLAMTVSCISTALIRMFSEGIPILPPISKSRDLSIACGRICGTTPISTLAIVSVAPEDPTKQGTS